MPARAYRPRDKAKAESGVLLVERWVVARLRKRRFSSLGALNDTIDELVDQLNDRPFKRLPGSRKSVFLELDRPALRPLPPTRYEFATWRRAKLGPDYHVEVRADHHYYSAPHSLVGQVLDVRLSARTVEVFHRHRRVASYPRSFTPGYTTDPAHMPDAHRRHASWTPARIVSWARKAGPATAKLAEAVLASRPHPEQGFRTCLGIVRLGGALWHRPPRSGGRARLGHSQLQLPLRRVHAAPRPRPPTLAGREAAHACPPSPCQRARARLLPVSVPKMPSATRQKSDDRRRGSRPPRRRPRGRAVPRPPPSRRRPPGAQPGAPKRPQ